MTDVNALQAMAGRFLTGSGLVSWETDSRQRLEALVSGFQSKALGADALHAAFAAERGARPTLPSQTAATAVIELTGVLTPNTSIFTMLGFGTSLRAFMSELTAAAVDSKVKSIIVAVDSPGGSVKLVPEAAALMRQIRGRKPIVAAVTGMAASAGYWIASNATAIESTPSGQVGSIGVISERASIAKMLEREGVDVTVFSAGRFKSEGHPATALSDAERTARQAAVDAMYGVFVGDVATGRQTSAALVRETYGQGRAVDAQPALAAGMIDKIAMTEETISRAIAMPATFAQVHTQRISAQRQAVTQSRVQHARDEIANYRQQLAAAAHGHVTS